MIRGSRSTPAHYVHRFAWIIQPYALIAIAVSLDVMVGVKISQFKSSFEERTLSAWQIVLADGFRKSGNKEALEYLNRVDGILCLTKTWCAITLKERIKLAGVFLPVSDVQRGSYLAEADLENAFLVDSNFHGSWMRAINLRNADLRGAIFTETRLQNADLQGAILSGRTRVPGTGAEREHPLSIDLSRSVLTGADLRGVVAPDTDTLIAILDQTCGDDQTRLPDDLKAIGYQIPVCSDQPWFEPVHIHENRPASSWSGPS
ncbi:MAG: pentapeptide repeat-containing protein [Pseudomonadota bacterium]